MNALLIFLGAGTGGVIRYWISIGTYLILGPRLPFGTFVVNVSGCFLMGLFYVLILERMNDVEQHLRLLLLIGFLGGYTTFSSFSIETLNLYENGYWLHAGLNILINVFACLLVTWLGVVAGRQL